MFTVLDRVSLPGAPDKANEDSCRRERRFRLGHRHLDLPRNAADHERPQRCHVARDLCERPTVGLAPNADDGATLIRHVMEEARVAFFQKALPERHDFMTWPVGAMTLVRWRDDVLDVWTFADTTTFVRPPGGAVITVGDAPELRRFEMAKAAELLKASGCTPKTIGQSPLFRDWLAGRRARQKQSGALALLGLDPSAADRMRHARVACPGGSEILLTSDGFSALVDLYGRMDAGELMQAALDQGLAALADVARLIETHEDPDGILFPRFKLSDDATALLLRV